MEKSNIKQVIKILIDNTDWKNLNDEILKKITDNSKEAGKQFAQFLQNGAKIITDEPKTIRDNRSLLWRMRQRLPASWRWRSSG